MSNLLEDVKSTINKLKKFNNNMICWGQPILDDRLEEFERRTGYTFPLDFKSILKFSNGISLVGVEVYGLDNSFKASSLDAIYEFEHLKTSHNMPAEFLPFSPDGRGNHYCLNLSKLNNNQCPVIFWQWILSTEIIMR